MDAEKAHQVELILNDGFDLVGCHRVEDGWEYRWHTTWESPPYRTKVIADDALAKLDWSMAVLLLQNA